MKAEKTGEDEAMSIIRGRIAAARASGNTTMRVFWTEVANRIRDAKSDDPKACYGRKNGGAKVRLTRL